MPSTESISESVFSETVTHAVQEVFQVMLGQTATLSSAAQPPITETSPAQEPLQISGPTVVGIVGFVGDLCGMIHFYIDESFANQVASVMLGMSPTEIAEAGNDVVNDAVGELTNMTVGAFKSQLADRGFPCRITIPSIMRGTHFSFQSTSEATRRIYRFSIGGQNVIIDLLIKAAPATKSGVSVPPFPAAQEIVG